MVESCLHCLADPLSACGKCHVKPRPGRVEGHHIAMSMSASHCHCFCTIKCLGRSSHPSVAVQVVHCESATMKILCPEPVHCHPLIMSAGCAWPHLCLVIELVLVYSIGEDISCSVAPRGARDVCRHCQALHWPHSDHSGMHALQHRNVHRTCAHQPSSNRRWLQ